MQPLTLRIFGAACATGHSCRAGLRRPCVEAQNMKGLNSKGLQFFSCLQPTNKTIFFGKKSHYCIILTWKCKKHSEESQEGCIRPGHLLNSEKLRLCEWWRRAGGREGSKTYVRGGMGRLGRYRLLLSAGREWSCRSDKGLKPTNMPEGFQVTRRCRGFHFSSANMLLLSFFSMNFSWN